MQTRFHAIFDCSVPPCTKEINICCIWNVYATLNKIKFSLHLFLAWWSMVTFISSVSSVSTPSSFPPPFAFWHVLSVGDDTFAWYNLCETAESKWLLSCPLVGNKPSSPWEYPLGKKNLFNKAAFLFQVTSNLNAPCCWRLVSFSLLMWISGWRRKSLWPVLAVSFKDISALWKSLHFNSVGLW